MPTFDDGKGGKKFHMNPQAGKSMFAGKPPEQSASAVAPAEQLDDNGDSDLVVCSHGDGTYHTEKKDGSDRVEHPDLAGAVTHVAHTMEPGGQLEEDLESISGKEPMGGDNEQAELPNQQNGGHSSVADLML